MKLSAFTDTGRVRSSNQDSYAIGELPDGGAWAVVCDGMGGHAGGNVASSVAVNVISEDIKEGFRNNMSLGFARNMLMSSINAANAAIIRQADENDELRGMGTTVVAALCYGEKAVVAHVGDSRCYHISDGEISQVTHDHSLVQELVDAGYITKDQANSHPNKNIITRALGVNENVDIDFYEVRLEDNDILLLCTDGLTNHVTEEEIIECTSGENISNYSTELVSRANDNGGTDNITAVIIANR
ncbi:MAG: Stp1/IreP family PP2C-type Ser/Thr phosphatase [Clostridiales bacterium]|nr:Stp1/IreP family PP2C-type Ser/Thr phosphatase [Clostridiales bacterium]